LRVSKQRLGRDHTILDSELACASSKGIALISTAGFGINGVLAFTHALRTVFVSIVTAGIDGALRVAANLRGDEIAQTIQLYMAYAPEPPFNSGTPETAPPAVLEHVRHSAREITAMREKTACRLAARFSTHGAA
jgi:hypothetical protein